ncbi:MAG: cyclopentanol dehydrogenase [Rhodospirillaceae bacterium]|nr:cyclopentanol dehydrogenase [Rhodospirillaceae bacterium]
MDRLGGKVALISGGARGQGAAEAKKFVEEGAKVVFGDILDDSGFAVEAEINKHSDHATYVHLDVTKEADWINAINVTNEKYGKLDILVNNAAIVINRVPIEERTIEEWDKVQAVNSRGVFLGAKHSIPAMRKSGGGSIINICSVAGYGQSTTQEPAYAASKGAVRIFSKVIAAQHAKENIRSNAIFPGPINTEMVHEAMSDPSVLSERLTRVPLGRLGVIEEIVAGVVFLASDESSYMTGGEMVIDGGATSM